MSLGSIIAPAVTSALTNASSSTNKNNAKTQVSSFPLKLLKFSALVSAISAIAAAIFLQFELMALGILFTLASFLGVRKINELVPQMLLEGNVNVLENSQILLSKQLKTSQDNNKQFQIEIDKLNLVIQASGKNFKEKITELQLATTKLATTQRDLKKTQDLILNMQSMIQPIKGIVSKLTDVNRSMGVEVSLMEADALLSKEQEEKLNADIALFGEDLKKMHRESLSMVGLINQLNGEVTVIQKTTQDIKTQRDKFSEDLKRSRETEEKLLHGLETLQKQLEHLKTVPVTSDSADGGKLAEISDLAKKVMDARERGKH